MGQPDGHWAAGYAPLASSGREGLTEPTLRSGGLQKTAAGAATPDAVIAPSQKQQASEEASMLSGVSRSPSEASMDHVPSISRTPSNLREYESVGSRELWKWLWLDFSLPARRPVTQMIRKKMRTYSFTDIRCIPEDEGEAVGLSRLSASVSASLGEGSQLAAVFTLVSSAMGAGCLSLPYMLRSSGVILGLLLLLAGSMLAHLSLVVLMVCSRYTDSSTMAKLVGIIYGGGSSRLVDFVIAVYGIAAVLCYLIFIGDFFSGIVNSPLVNVDVSRGSLILGVAITVVWPLSLPRSLSALRHVCVLSVMAVCLTALAVACRAPAYIEQLHEQSDSIDEAADFGKMEIVWWNADALSTLQSFSIALFSFAAHTNAVPVAVALKKPDAASIWRVSLYSVLIELFFYILMGIGGYISFRGFTHQDFILNYRNDDFVMFIVRCIYGVVVCLGAPINLSPAASSILGLISTSHARHSWSLHAVVATIIVAGSTVVAIWSEHIADVIGLIGASFGSLIVLAWPAAVYRRCLADSHPPLIAQCVFYSLSSAAVLGFAAFSVQAYSAWLKWGEQTLH
mmetsp:Transcript_52115/g.124131  ORF Transcript_52115/g.124131 Transcript_52115/m.124131 type:complete len:568 (-) Transcript_52115:260-1963(-)|eukprot:CAMPEP_0178384292 /NCGR_PEP_ID=MMETSP0689_2-20121128/7441_1 /TAXON_ID=160604 /ORGANISM="Amphidinium massartii, Strain CS-259" /LENGTH=567 /DNA_ID=CAMNT_0020004537 /DNA_START=61 /DNA_END=1764 /DNA_ORIENTATION=+